MALEEALILGQQEALILGQQEAPTTVWEEGLTLDWVEAPNLGQVVLAMAAAAFPRVLTRTSHLGCLAKASLALSQALLISHRYFVDLIG